MKSVFREILVALLAIIGGTLSVQAQSVNMERYITLTVKKGKMIYLHFEGEDEDTQLRIISGATDTTITGGLLVTRGFKAQADTMTVYGNLPIFRCSFNYGNVTALNVYHNTQLKVLDCSSDSITKLDVSKNIQLEELSVSQNYLTSIDVSRNTNLTFLDCFGNKLTALDISHNQKLNKLYCFDNDHLTTSALDDVYCNLPDRKGQTAGIIRPYSGYSSKNMDTVLATNGSNATSKNWKIQDHETWKEITGFTGTKQCSGGIVNMERYITLNVKEGENIFLDIWADVAGTQVKIVSGSNEQTITADSAWTGSKPYVAKAGTMTIYGNVWQFNCHDNAANITGLDASNNAKLQALICNNNAIASLNVSGNTDLIGLYCLGNALTTLDVSKNMKLQSLYCYENPLNTLDISNNAELAFLDCRSNNLTALDVSRNKKLKVLNCRSNKLTTLDVSNNTELEFLYCFENALTALDLSHNSALNSLYCHSNNFTTAALDDIYCSLPNRSGQAVIGLIQPLLNASSPDKDKVLATNGSNAAARNWALTYYEDDDEITGFTGTHQCTSGIDEVENVPSFTVYPNPVKDILHITSEKPVHSIRVYNVYGTEVLHATDVMSLNVSHLPAGVYMVRVDGRVTRIIKE